MSAQQVPRLTPEQYLEADRASRVRHEYHGGRMWAMSGAIFAHVRVTSRFMRELGIALKGSGCEAFGPDARLRVSPDGLYSYPDLMVFCGRVQLAGEPPDLFLNPTMLMEVLSPSTEAYDRGLKATQYRTIRSLREYAFASQEEPRVEVFRRTDSGQWLLTEFAGMTAVCEFSSIECRIPLNEIYEGISPATE